MEDLIKLLTENAVAFWLIVAVAAGVLEAVTVGLVSVWFSVGAAAAAFSAAFGLRFDVQMAVFIAASIVSLLLTRPFLKKVLHVKKTPTNAEKVIGQRGVVTSQIDNVFEKGRVLADGLEWEARSEDGSRLEKGDIVIVKELRGVKLIVKKIYYAENGEGM
ncbi:MAG: NfeD family protein [Synergistes sp.]|nr:NfeD family protein [Synergistes sp.]